MTPPGKITVVTAAMEFPLCPSIFTGRTADGSTIFVRYRWGRLSIRLDHRYPAPSDGAEGRRVLERIIDPEGLDGQLSYDELKENTADWIEWPAELTPKAYDEGGLIDL